jgi:hypothetical protein
MFLTYQHSQRKAHISRVGYGDFIVFHGYISSQIVYFIKQQTSPRRITQWQSTVGSIRSPYFLLAAHFVGQNRAAPKPPTYNLWISASPLTISKQTLLSNESSRQTL